MKLDELLEQARRAAKTAYAPYSGLQIGAIAITEDGRTFSGANVENASYSSTLCAEAVAIGSAIAAGADRVDTVVVASQRGGTTPPCGNCRQIMNEFGVTRVIVEGDQGKATALEFRDVLPNSFGSNQILRDAPLRTSKTSAD